MSTHACVSRIRRWKCCPSSLCTERRAGLWRRPWRKKQIETSWEHCLIKDNRGSITMEYNVQLESFRGPLDLLLYLVKRHEVDIRDIPIARVAEQFLEYLQVIQLIDVEWAGDFLVMAATLMEIKSKMLLPRVEEDAAEEDDPRLELVKQLIEYKKYKEAAALLEEQSDRQLARLPRVPPETPQPLDPARQPLQAVELWDLVSAFGRLMRETNALQPRQI